VWCNFLHNTNTHCSACKASHPSIIVKYLPSINISYGFVEADENYNLFLALRNQHPDLVVGMDLSGDATKGKFSTLKSIFDRARADGFRFAIHCAESEDENEILDKLEFMEDGDRIGHGTFIDGILYSRSRHVQSSNENVLFSSTFLEFIQETSPAVWKAFTAKCLPIEICLTSNVLCRSVPSYEDHHISRFIRKYPIMICVR
jgi:adenosine deaminase